ncbi:MAG: cytidylyltransferase domain-containing protein, partial [Chthoniobacterales bacterium]
MRRMQKNPALKMITAAHPFRSKREVASPHQVKVLLDSRKKKALDFSRAPIRAPRSGALRATGDQEGPPGDSSSLLLRHQGIYGYTRELLLRFVEWKPSPLERAE